MENLKNVAPIEDFNGMRMKTARASLVPATKNSKKLTTVRLTK